MATITSAERDVVRGEPRGVIHDGWNRGEASNQEIRSAELSLGLNACGELAQIRVADLQISQYAIGPHDVPVGGLWLRHHACSGLQVMSLTGAYAHGRHRVFGNGAVWSGEGLDVDWRVTLTADEHPEQDASWSWTIEIQPGRRNRNPADVHDGVWDVVSAQDLALAPTAQALTSEPYISQYVAFHVHNSQDLGKILAARQTMACAPRLPLYLTSIREGCAGYMTDGFDFYGTSARLGREPRALKTADWSANRIDQYEFSMACMQAKPRPLVERLVWHVDSSVALDYRGELDKVSSRYEESEVRRRACSGAKASLRPAGQHPLDQQPAEQQPVTRRPVARQLAEQRSVDQPATVERHEESRDSASLLVSAPLLDGDDLDNDALRALSSGAMESPEYDDSGKLLSFFGPRARHVVSRGKELRVDRSHGQILLCGCDIADPNRHAFAATTYAPGVFASHVVLGNTNMNRLVSVQHTSLNLLRSQGVRILVRAAADQPSSIGHDWMMLGVPSAYIMEVGGSQWIYRIGESTVTVDTTAAADCDQIDIRLQSTSPLDFMLTVEIEQGGDWDIAGSLDRDMSGVVLVPAKGTAPASACPGLSYAMASRDASVGDDAALFKNDGMGDDKGDGGINGVANGVAENKSHDGTAGPTHGTGIILFNAACTSMVHVVMAGGMNGPERLGEQVRERLIQIDESRRSMEDERDRTLQRQFGIIDAYSQRLRVHGNNRLREFNLVVPWFVQNALVHFLSPHGLEQYSGAAWGTRDVCQGPFESALAFGHYDVARMILLKVFRHQNSDGSLPQWFMFDEYAAMYQHDSHGDIPVWPLMAVGEYLDATSDWSILDAKARFWETFDGSAGDFRRAGVPRFTPTVGNHLERTLAYIRAHRVPGTELFSYGEGDWDDTLQPAQESMKKDMASTWTIALLYQAAHTLAGLLNEADSRRFGALATAFANEAAIIRSNFTKDFIFDGVLAGYVSFPQGKPTPMIHPSDQRTGIKYRLIPMTRSIIAGLLDESATRRHEVIIERHLHYPDGVRLMSSPASFHDGVTTVFKRAEQAANVGREIGLMYTHAHIRYVEALAALGRERLGDELLRISPVGQFSRLAMSEPRQRNCYFASSDADFPDRYTAAREWSCLRADAENPVGVRGGWRVYSSGPGIYLRQMMQHLFGIQLHVDRVVFDPILEIDDDGTTVDVMLFGAMRHVRYHVTDDDSLVGVVADGRALSGRHEVLPYRRGGLSVSARELADAQHIEVTVGGRR